MGNLGFVFKSEKKQIVIFTFSNKFDENIILGSISNFIISENFEKDCKFYFLTNKLKLEKFIILDDFKYKYSKIKVFNEKIVDFEDFVFYLKPKEYKKLKNLLEIENFSNEILIKNILEIYPIFN